MFDYFDEEPFFQAKDTVKPISGFPKNMVCTWQNKLVNSARKKYTSKTIGTFHTGVICPIYSMDCNGFETGLILLPVGGPCVSGFIEEATFWGAENFVFAGYCGVLNEEVQNRIIVPTKALRDEGTSYHYISSDDEFVEISTSERTERILKEKNIPLISGPVWTTDSLYRETKQAIDLAVSKQCLGVDMECACIHAVAKARGINCSQFFFTADRLTGDHWDVGKMKTIENDAYLRYFELAVDLLK